MQDKKILFLQNLVYPIRTPFFNLLSSKEKLNIKTFYLSDTSNNRKWDINNGDMKFSYKILKNVRIPTYGKDTFDYVFNPFAIVDFFKEKYDVLVSIGWANPTNMIFMLFSIIFRRKYYIWCESTINESGTLRNVTRPIVKFFVSHARACIVPGSLAKKYILSLYNKSNIIVVPNSVDNKRFLNAHKKRISRRTVNILYLGRFEKVKSLETLLMAFKKIQIIHKNVLLKMVGYGPERENILEIIKKMDIKNVTVDGFVTQNKIPSVYKSSDIFVLPSYKEVWGFVVNEAMASGLPVIVSDKVGSSEDLVKNGVNGYIFKSGNYIDLYSKLTKLVDSKRVREDMGRNSLKIISNYTYDKMVEAFVEGIKKYE